MRKVKKIGVLAVLVLSSLALIGNFSSAGDSVKTACTHTAVHAADACEAVLRGLNFSDSGEPSGLFFPLGWMSLVRRAVKPNASCEQCQLQVDQFYDRLSSNQTINDIGDAGHLLCGELFVNDVVACEAAVDQFVPQAIQALVDGLPPFTACQNLGICAP